MEDTAEFCSVLDVITTEEEVLKATPDPPKRPRAGDALFTEGEIAEAYRNADKNAAFLARTGKDFDAHTAHTVLNLLADQIASLAPGMGDDLLAIETHGELKNR